ncbi:MAG TPA: Asp-tRNA(Asn)/Glu-tRNA(Gln) amidotransferase GatCAB subunit C, partial [Clostridiales bacterium]|nr:Asp-tRNA(Asn)/Glu-tRNA(Gln) amidotransferase GatCAB subunit C [Clostridiales bacterium]
MSGTLKNETLKGFKRSMRCGELTRVSVGRKVTVMGWVHRRRNLGSMIFVDLRDRTGLLQIVFYESGDKELFETAQSLRSEFVVAVTGTVIPRTGDMINTRMPTGEVEVKAEELRVLSRAETTP